VKRIWALAAVLGLAAIFAVQVGGAPPTTVYDNIPTPQPGNVPSIAYEAHGIAEWGGQIQLAGTARQNPTVTVLMSSWGCETGHWYSNDCMTSAGATFSHPITLNIYNANPDGSVGSLITTTTQTFDIPYRPSVDPTCGGGRWRSTSDGQCYNGHAAPISFDLAGLTLPDTVIVSVAYDTTHYGYSPLGEQACYSGPGGCGYDSLNVGTAPAPTTGITPRPDDAYMYSVHGSVYCDGGIQGTSVFRLDQGCWTGFQPAFRVVAMSVNEPPNAEACKNGGWKNHTRADGSTFRNQGDCIQYVNTGK
jgi:hypothetical protein